MKFTRFQMILLTLGFIGMGSGLFFWMLVTHDESVLIEQPGDSVERISADYSYSPIIKANTVIDLEQGETSTFSKDGRIKVNLNSSSIDELKRLPGVGASTALRILEHRLENGPFIKVEEVDKIKGIGKKTIEKFADQAFVGNPDPLDAELIIYLKDSLNNKKTEAETVTIEAGPCGPGRINVNTATADELVLLPRVGPKTAERIIADRTLNGPFKDANDLVRVKGIGPKTLAKMKDKICAE